jgi:hypothetical protein
MGFSSCCRLAPCICIRLMGSYEDCEEGVRGLASNVLAIRRKKLLEVAASELSYSSSVVPASICCSDVKGYFRTGGISWIVAASTTCASFFSRRQRFRQMRAGRPSIFVANALHDEPNEPTSLLSCASSSEDQSRERSLARGSKISQYRLEHWSSFLPGIFRAIKG